MDFEIVFEFFEIKELSQAPRIPQGSPEVAPGASKIGLKIDQNFDAILVSFLVPLGPLLASHLGPFWSQNRTKIALGCVLSSKTSIFKN